MSKENEIKVENMEKSEETKEVKDKGDDLRKKVDSIAFTVRKIKDWMEEKMGADIDGDGRVGGGPYKKVLAFLFMFGIASMCSMANTNIAVWTGTESSPTAGVHDDGGVFAPYFVGDVVLPGRSIGAGEIDLANTYIYVGNAGNTGVAVAVSGDASLSNVGVLTVTNGSLAALKLNNGTSLTGVTALAMSAAGLTAGTVVTAIDISAATNANASELKSGTVDNARLDTNSKKLGLNDGGSLTNMAPATAFPGYAVCIVTNLDVNGTTNIITYIGTVSRNQ